MATDVFSRRKRSEVMGRIRSRGNRDTEVRLAHIMRVHKISGWRRQLPLLGRPDFTFPNSCVTVFVDGCFWHGCPKHATKPKQNSAFWQKKLNNNVRRDKYVTRTLRKKGWAVIRIWEHDLRNEEKVVRRIRAKLS